MAKYQNSTLWRNPFYSPNSIKILINCLLEEDKDSLTGIELNFELLEKAPLYNYARFCTIIEIQHNHRFIYLIKNSVSNPLQILINKLGSFILDYSAGIRKLCPPYNIECNILINHHRFDNCFRNLYEISYNSCYSGEFLDKLANICKNIQSLKSIYHIPYDEKIYK